MMLIFLWNKLLCNTNLRDQQQHRNICDVRSFRKFGKSEKYQQHKNSNGVSQDVDGNLRAAEIGGEVFSAYLDGGVGGG